MLQRSSANNKNLSQSISTLTQKLAVHNASDNTSSVQKQPGSHNVHLPTCQHQTTIIYEISSFNVSNMGIPHNQYFPAFFGALLLNGFI
jgi:diaminopimelate epimerase